MARVAEQTGDYRSAGWGRQIINHNYLQLIHFQAVENKQPAPLEELTVRLQVACGCFGNDLKPRGDKRRAGGGEGVWVMASPTSPLPPDWGGGGYKGGGWSRDGGHILAGLVLLFHPTSPPTASLSCTQMVLILTCSAFAPASAFQRPIHSTPAGVFLQTHAHAVLTHIIVSRRTRLGHFRSFTFVLRWFICVAFIIPSECQSFTNMSWDNQQLLRSNTSKENI